jgi:hypothetical protein
LPGTWSALAPPRKLDPCSSAGAPDVASTRVTRAFVSESPPGNLSGDEF